MDSNVSEGNYELTEEDYAGLPSLDDPEPEVEVVEPEDSEAVVEDQPEADDTSAASSEDKSETAKEKSEAARRSWREVIGAEDIDWSDFAEAKLNELPTHVASQRQYLSRQGTILQQKIAEYENKLAELQTKAPAPESGPAGPASLEEPPHPSLDHDDAETFMAKYKAREAWVKQSAVREAQAGQSELLERLQRVEQERESEKIAQQERMVEERISHIKKLPGCTDEVWERIDHIAKEHPQIGFILANDDGAARMIKLVKTELDELHAKTQKVAHAASAPDRVIPRTVTRASSRDSVVPANEGTTEESIYALLDRPEFQGLF